MSLPDSSCGQFQEGLESKTSYILSIKIVKNIVDKFVGSCKSQTDECIFELDWIYDSTWVTIKDVKCTFDLSHFLDWDSFSDIVLCCPLFLDLFVVLSFFGLWLVSIGNSWAVIPISPTIFLLTKNHLNNMNLQNIVENKSTFSLLGFIDFNHDVRFDLRTFCSTLCEAYHFML